MHFCSMGGCCANVPILRRIRRTALRNNSLLSEASRLQHNLMHQTTNGKMCHHQTTEHQSYHQVVSLYYPVLFWTRVSNTSFHTSGQQDRGDCFQQNLQIEGK